MPFLLHRPQPADIAARLGAQADVPYSYSEVGATRRELPSGYDHAECRVELGRGEACWVAAQAAVRGWHMFDMPWIELHGRDTPPRPGVCVAPVVRVLGVWILNVARVVYMIDEPRRFGFAYGTLPAHIECGEERFLVGRDSDGSVWYELSVFSRPRPWWARLGKPVVLAWQRRFRTASGQAMQRAVMG